MWTQFTRRVGRDKLTLEDAKAYVQKRLESYLEWAIVYHECDPTDQDDLDDFNEDLESTFVDEDMVIILLVEIRTFWSFILKK